MKSKHISIALGIVFLCAALYRILNLESGIAEISALSLPSFFVYVVIGLELTIATLLFSLKHQKIACKIGIVFLSLALLFAFISNGAHIIANVSELFVFDATPTDVFLHLIYLLLLIYLLRSKN